MKELTRRAAIYWHRKLWDFLYHHPSKNKDDWPGWHKINNRYGGILDDCFACELAYNEKNNIKPLDDRCDYCALDWRNAPCFENRSIYKKWRESGNPKTRKKYAKIIRDLKVRKL